MARVSFSALIEEITGKLAGSVFQDSYQGFQIRTRVSPRNPRTQYQQLRRGEFGFLTQSWRELTPTERATWIANAPAGMQGINFFVQSNINLILIGLSQVNSYSAGGSPDAMPLEIVTLDSTIFEIQASGIISTVPAGQRLLVQTTFEKAPSKIFTNPSMYSPTIHFEAGTDLSAPFDIATQWKDRYGQFTEDKRICIKSNLIDKTSGARGVDSIYCAIESAPSTSYIIDSDGTFVIDSDGTFISFP